MTRGRKPRTAEVAGAIDESLDQPKIEGAMVRMRADAQEDLFELCELAGDVKALQMADLTVKFLRAAEIRLFQRIRESKKIKDLPLRDVAGNLRRAETIEEFCPLVFGRSYTKMAEEAQNFDLLGEESYEAASRLGLNRTALRAARALPPEKLETVRLAIANGSTKAEVLSVIEDLAVRIEETEKALADAKGDLEAKDHLLVDKGKKIDQLKAQQKRIASAPADEQLALDLKEVAGRASTALAYVRGELRLAFQHLQDLEQSGGASHRHIMAGYVNDLQFELDVLRADFFLAAAAAE